MKLFEILFEENSIVKKLHESRMAPKLFVVPKNFLGIKNGFKRLLWAEKFLGNFLLFRGYVWQQYLHPV